MSEITLGPAHRGELRQILDWCQMTQDVHAAMVPEIFADGRSHLRLVKAHRRSFTRALLIPRRDSRNIFCARKDGALLGYVALAHSVFGTSVSDIFVDQAHRREGVGLRLLDHAIKTCAQRGRQKLTATVWRGNPGSAVLFERAGFGQTFRLYEIEVAPDA